MALEQEEVALEQVEVALEQVEVEASFQQTFLTGLASSFLYLMSVDANLGDGDLPLCLGLVSGGDGGSTGKDADGGFRIPLGGA